MTFLRKAIIISASIVLALLITAVILLQPGREVDPVPNPCSVKGGICKLACNATESIINVTCPENKICCNILPTQ